LHEFAKSATFQSRSAASEHVESLEEGDHCRLLLGSQPFNAKVPARHPPAGADQDHAAAVRSQYRLVSSEGPRPGIPRRTIDNVNVILRNARCIVTGHRPTASAYVSKTMVLEGAAPFITDVMSATLRGKSFRTCHLFTPIAVLAVVRKRTVVGSVRTDRAGAQSDLGMGRYCAAAADRTDFVVDSRMRPGSRVTHS
jgi:hypothetical protein